MTTARHCHHTKARKKQNKMREKKATLTASSLPMQQSRIRPANTFLTLSGRTTRRIQSIQYMINHNITHPFKPYFYSQQPYGRYGTSSQHGTTDLFDCDEHQLKGKKKKSLVVNCQVKTGV
jgi:hypothetical protein